MIALADRKQLPNVYRLVHDTVRHQLKATTKVAGREVRVTFAGQNSRPNLLIQNISDSDVSAFVDAWERSVRADGFNIRRLADGRGNMSYLRAKPDDTLEMTPPANLLRRARPTPVDPH